MISPQLDKSMQLVFGDGAFARLDETSDAMFYARDRFVAHLDAKALATVERLISTLVVEEHPDILDLMAGWDSHLPPDLGPGRVVGVGLNPRELKQNPRLTERVLQDLNQEPELRFPDASFDLVLDTISIQYATRPFELFAEVARVLRPGGLHLVVFSNRMFPRKAVKVWRDASEDERVLLVEDYFRAIATYDRTESFLSAGLRRPEDDPHAHELAYSDPIYAIYAERSGGPADRPPRPRPSAISGALPDPEEIARRKARIRDTLRCPYCNAALERWDVPDDPFCQWDNEYVLVCLNNDCPYFQGGFEVMAAQGNLGFSYRLLYDPDRNVFQPVALPNPATVRKSMLAPRG